MRRSFEDFRFVRRIRKINLAAQIVLGLILVVALNFLAARHYYKYDLSANKVNSLSPESAARSSSPALILATPRPTLNMLI